MPSNHRVDPANVTTGRSIADPAVWHITTMDAELGKGGAGVEISILTVSSGAPCDDVDNSDTIGNHQADCALPSKGNVYVCF